MFDALINAWKEFFAKYFANSRIAHQRAEEEWQNWNGHNEEDIEMKVDQKRIEEEQESKAKKKKSGSGSTEITLAIGWFRDAGKNRRFVAAKQKAPLPPDFVGMYPPPVYKGEELVDVHEELLGTLWYQEPTGVHAEMMIIRYWLEGLGGATAQNLARLKDAAVIVASQPACWCCARFMKKYGIAFPADAGLKPKTGWRHPLNRRTVPNSNIPSNELNITDKWIDTAAQY
jgi:hypothetical protein